MGAAVSLANLWPAPLPRRTRGLVPSLGASLPRLSPGDALVRESKDLTKRREDGGVRGRGSVLAVSPHGQGTLPARSSGWLDEWMSSGRAGQEPGSQCCSAAAPVRAPGIPDLRNPHSPPAARESRGLMFLEYGAAPPLQSDSPPPLDGQAPLASRPELEGTGEGCSPGLRVGASARLWAEPGMYRRWGHFTVPVGRVLQAK